MVWVATNAALAVWLAAAPTPQTRALDLFKKSEVEYRAGRFADAVSLLEEAWKLHPEPLLQYNLARAREGLGDVPGAVAAYELYLSLARDVKDRPAVEQRVATLKRQLDEKAALEAEKKRAEADKREAEAVAKAALERPAPYTPKPPNRAPWVIAGTGMAALVAAVFCGVFALVKRGVATDLTVTQVDASQALGQAYGTATAANVLFPVGGALSVAGILWGVLQ